MFNLIANIQLIIVKTYHDAKIQFNHTKCAFRASVDEHICFGQIENWLLGIIPAIVLL